MQKGNELPHTEEVQDLTVHAPQPWAAAAAVGAAVGAAAAAEAAAASIHQILTGL